MTGELPAHVADAANVGIGVNHTEMVAKGRVPVCKDNLKGECRRGSLCKYRHISNTEYEFLQRKSEGRESMSSADSRYDRYDSYDAEMSFKRRRMDPDFGNESFRQFDNPGRGYPPLSPSNRPMSYQLLEEENFMLRKKIEELKKQVSDLTATNEVLLEQNARYRVSKSNILQTLSPASLQGAFQPSNMNHLNTSLAQQIAMNSDLSTLTQQQHQAMQQRIVREAAALAAGQCSIAGPQSLNTATMSMNPPAMVPVSLPQTMSGMPQSNNQTNPDMNAASMVSYPISSQGMRMSAHAGNNMTH